MAGIDQDWLLVRTNIRRLMQAADDTAEDEELPRPLRNIYIDLEALLRKLEQMLRRYDM